MTIEIHTIVSNRELLLNDINLLCKHLQEVYVDSSINNLGKDYIIRLALSTRLPNLDLQRFNLKILSMLDLWYLYYKLRDYVVNYRTLTIDKDKYNAV